MVVLVLALFLVTAAEYVGPTGYWQAGESWTGLCASGAMQSPMPVTSTQVVLQTDPDFKLLRTNYTTDTVQSHITGAHFLIYGDFGVIVSTGENYVPEYQATVDRIYVKSPAEHEIDGKQFDLEVQIYHRTQGASSSQVALSVLYQLSDDSSDFLDSVISSVSAPTAIDLSEAFEGMLELYNYYAYLGSETFPPCHEPVQWLLWAEIRPISRDQLGYFARLWQGDPEFADGKGNNRKQQEMNGRQAWRYQGLLSDVNEAGALVLAVLLLS